MYKWNPFPHDNSAFTYEGARLKKAWEDLHSGDLEPFPANATLQEAWRCYHRGDFQQAVVLADECGIEGHDVILSHLMGSCDERTILRHPVRPRSSTRPLHRT